ncbi:MAG: hypothetical protein KME26_27145 [Oscillatoria princeps RMCB-10]|nr:hypothetical protein [Oscillatoria princeps RMCB-10]
MASPGVPQRQWLSSGGGRRLYVQGQRAGGAAGQWPSSEAGGAGGVRGRRQQSRGRGPVRWGAVAIHPGAELLETVKLCSHSPLATSHFQNRKRPRQLRTP